MVVPVRVRGLKFISADGRVMTVDRVVVPRAGTWIEMISARVRRRADRSSYPVRVRGLKSSYMHRGDVVTSRTRAGTWIEIQYATGARADHVVPVRVRGLKYLTWIVIASVSYPVRVRGLKSSEHL